MVDKTTITVGILILLLASTGILYITLTAEGLKIRIDADQATFYALNENNRYVVVGRELTSVWEGTTKLNRKLDLIELKHEFYNKSSGKWELLGLDFKILPATNIKSTRTTYYKSNISIRESWVFDASNPDANYFPVRHYIECFNCQGRILQYEVRDLIYDGPTIKNVESPQSFGMDMKVEWEADRSYWNTLYKSGIIKIRFKPTTNYEKYETRLFDPAGDVILELEGTEANINAELGSQIEVNATIENSSAAVCVDIPDSPEYGINYSCNASNTSFIFNLSSFVLVKFNDSTKSKQLLDSSQTWVRDELLCDSDWAPNHNCTNLVDHDWYTEAHSKNSTTLATAYINFTPPTAWANVDNTIIRWKMMTGDGETVYLYNSTVPSFCFGIGQDTNIMIESNYLNTTAQTAAFYCYWFGVTWILMESYPLGIEGYVTSTGQIYEFEIVSERWTNVSINLDNQTVISSGQFNISGLEQYTGNTTDVQISFGLTNRTDIYLLGKLIGTLLEYDEFIFNKIEYDRRNITFPAAGSNVIYINMSTNGIVSDASMELVGFDVDRGLNFDFYERFVNSTYLNTTRTTGAAPLVSFNNFERGNISSYSGWTHTYSEVDSEPDGCTGVDCFNWEIWNTNSTNVNGVTEGLSKNYLVHSQARGYGRHDETRVRWMEDLDTNFDYRNTSMFEISGHWNLTFIKHALFGGSLRCITEMWSAIYLTDGSTREEIYRHSGNQNIYDNVTAIRQQNIESDAWKVYIDGVFVKNIYTGGFNKNESWNLLFVEYLSSSSPYQDCESKYNLTVEYYDIKIGGAGLKRDAVNSTGYNSAKNLIGSINLTTFSADVSAATLYDIAYKPSGTNISYYLSNDCENWTRFVPGYRAAFESTGKKMCYNISMESATNTTGIVQQLRITVVPSSGENITVDVGIDGTIDGGYNGVLNSSSSPQIIDLTNNSAIDYYVSEQCANQTVCAVPIEIHTECGGIIMVQDLSINKSVNPISFNTSLIENLNGDIPIGFSFLDGSIIISDLRIYYLGGNESFTIRAHNSNYSTNTTYDAILFYSDYNWTYPAKISYFEFIPKSPTSKNVTPYGQSRLKPIFNITLDNWGGKTANFSIYLNESYACVNLTASTSYNKSVGTLITNNTWHDFGTNLSYESEIDLWFWADYNCNYTNWVFWEPTLYFRGCCYECDLCDEDVASVS